jgi:hypothetical protein
MFQKYKFKIEKLENGRECVRHLEVSERFEDTKLSTPWAKYVKNIFPVYNQQDRLVIPKRDIERFLRSN